jgi:hypothetical protein
MASTPSYIGTPKIGVAQISTANTNRDGTGTIGTVFTAGSSGSRIERVVVVAPGTTTAGVIRLFIHDGTNYRLYREILVTAITPSTTIEVYRAELVLNDFILPNGYSLRASTHNAETFNVEAFGGDF